MQQGTLAENSFSQLLRGISQRRRQGVLEIEFPQQRVELHFNQGKIIEVIEGNSNPVEEIAAIMKGAGLLSQKLNSESWNESYRKLFLALSEVQPAHKTIEEQAFARIIKHRVLNKLYNLAIDQGGRYSFHVGLMEVDKSFSPNISVGQLLLDLVALESERQRFESLFCPESVVARAVDELDGPLPEEQVLIFRLIGAGMRISDLARVSMLSLYHFREGLLGLYEQELLKILDERNSAALEAARSFRMDSSIFHLDMVVGDALTAVEESLSDIDTGYFAGLERGGLEVSSQPSFDAESEMFDQQDLRSQRAKTEILDQEQVSGELARPAVAVSSQPKEEYESLVMKLGVDSFHILNSSWVTHAMEALFLFLALVLPYLAWFGALNYFSN